MWLIILSFVFIVVLYWRTYKKQYPPGFPPGPRHFLPYFGDPLFAIGKDSLVGFTSMHKKFGAIVGFNIGGLRVISINDQDILQKVEGEARNDPQSKSCKSTECLLWLFSQNVQHGIKMTAMSIGCNIYPWHGKTQFNTLFNSYFSYLNSKVVSVFLQISYKAI